MTVVCLTNCPPRLRGDLTKWLMEINTGVYVGRISARIRDELWKRITENIRPGQATMVFHAAGEQHMDFRVHNTTWKPVDYDGIKLMQRPATAESADIDGAFLPNGFSKAAKNNTTRKAQRSAVQNAALTEYTILDLETTGLDPEKDSIIEIAALRIRSKKIESEFHALVLPVYRIPGEIEALTGITEEMLREQGWGLRNALSGLVEFIGSDKLLCWNSPFDIAFLQNSCVRCGIPVIRNKGVDAMKLAQKKLSGLSNYRLTTVARHLGIECSSAHRALEDCRLTFAVISKLNENSIG